MPATAPEDVQSLFSEALNAGDLDGIMSLFELEATLLSQPGQPVTGAEAIREAMSGFLATKPAFESELQTVLEAGDLALLSATWTLRGTGPASAIELAGRTSDAVRRQPDGMWRLVIDNPWGLGGG